MGIESCTNASTSGVCLNKTVGGKGLEAKNVLKNYVFSHGRGPPRLRALEASTGPILPPFDPYHSHYVASARYEHTTMRLLTSRQHGTVSVKHLVARPRARGEVADTLELAEDDDIPLYIGLNTIRTVLTGMHGVKGVYTIEVTRAPGPSLQTLVLPSGVLSPMFNPATYAYTLTVAHRASSTTVDARLDPASAQAQILINQDADSTVDLSANGDLVRIELVPASGGPTVVYTVTVVRGPPVLELQALSLSAGTLVPAFTSDRLAYTVKVPHSVQALRVTPIAGPNVAIDSAITIHSAEGAQTVESGQASDQLALAEGNNSLRCEITANGLKPVSYAVAVYREGPLELDALAVDGGTLTGTFSPDQYDYEITVLHSADSVALAPSLDDPSSGTIEVKIGAEEVTPGADARYVIGALAVGVTTVTISAVPPAGAARTVYSITITRQDAVELKALSTGDQELVPDFSSSNRAYTMTVPLQTASVAIAPEVRDYAPPVAIVVKVGQLEVASSNGTYSVPLETGLNAIEVRLTPSGGGNTIVYGITAAREAELLLSTLDVSGASLSPAFASDKHAYSATVPDAVASLTLNLEAQEHAPPHSTEVKIGGVTLTPADGKYTVPLSVGSNAIEVRLHPSRGGSAVVYSMTVTREDTLRVESLNVSGAQLNPAFASGTFTYTSTVTNSQSSVALAPRPPTYAPSHTVIVKVGGAIVAPVGGEYTVPLSVGPNAIEVRLDPSEGENDVVYSMTVTRENKLELESLGISGAQLDTSFTPGNYTYTSEVVNARDSIVLTPRVLNYTPSHDVIVKVGGADVAPTGDDYTITLAPGPNAIEVLLKPAQGDNTEYSIAVYREGELKLATLDVPGVAFDPAVYSYSAIVPHATASVSVTLSVQEHAPANTVTVEVGSTTVEPAADGSFPVPVSVGPNSLKITIDPSDESSPATVYEVALTRRAELRLQSLELSWGDLDPVFAADEFAYAVTLTNSQTATALTPVVASHAPPATMVVERDPVGVIPRRDDKPAPYAVADLDVGVTNVSITLTENNNAANTVRYGIAITREAEARLSSLSVAEKGGGAIELDPAFDPATSSYALASTASELTFTPTLQSSAPASVITVAYLVRSTSIGSIGSVIVLDSTQPAADVPLESGKVTDVTVAVIPLSGGPQVEYSVECDASLPADLESLTVSAGSLSPSFAAGHHSYSVTLTNAQTGLTIGATPASGLSTPGVTVKTGQTEILVTQEYKYEVKNLEEGTTRVTIEVTADGRAASTYEVDVARERQALLSGIDLKVPLWEGAHGGTLPHGECRTDPESCLFPRFSYPLFSPSTFAYAVQATLVDGSGRLWVKPTLAPDSPDSNVQITSQIRGKSITDITPAGPQYYGIIVLESILISDVTITVSPKSGGPPVVYTVAAGVYALEAPKMLSIATSAGSLSPAFSTSTTTYAVTLPSSAPSITLTPTLTTDSAGLVSVDGIVTASGVPTAVSLGSGTTSISVVSQSLHEPTQNTTYTVNVSASAADQLSSLTINSPSASSWSPAFSPGHFEYDVTLSQSPSYGTTWTPTSATGNKIRIYNADLSWGISAWGSVLAESGQLAFVQWFATAFTPTRQHLVFRVVEADGVTPVGREYRIRVIV